MVPSKKVVFIMEPTFAKLAKFISQSKLDKLLKFSNLIKLNDLYLGCRLVGHPIEGLVAIDTYTSALRNQ